MMRSVVIYSSKTGFTKKYAKWLAEDLSADIFDATKVTAEMLEGYDTIIYGGGLYALGISGVEYIKQMAYTISTDYPLQAIKQTCF